MQLSSQQESQKAGYKVTCFSVPTSQILVQPDGFWQWQQMLRAPSCTWTSLEFQGCPTATPSFSSQPLYCNINFSGLSTFPFFHSFPFPLPFPSPSLSLLSISLSLSFPSCFFSFSFFWMHQVYCFRWVKQCWKVLQNPNPLYFYSFIEVISVVR